MKTTTTLVMLMMVSEADLRWREMREEHNRQIMEAFCLPAEMVRGESAGVREGGGSSPPRPT